MKKKILAIIPARGGSKGLPGKNIKPLLGKPLLVYAIDAIKESRYDVDIVISTDSDEIAQVGKMASVETIKRPDYLATDNARVKDAIQYTIKELKKQGREYEEMLLIEATSPLRDGKDIDECLDAFFSDSEADCLATFSEMDPPVTRVWDIKGNIPTPFIKGSNPFRPRQEQISGYYINGLVYVFKIATLMRNTTDTLFVGKQLAVITKKPIVDIDTQLDFDIAELILKNKKNETIK